MLSVDEALKLVLDHARPLAPEQTDVAAALGRVLAQPIGSDIDSPPYDKSIVDGYAIIAADAGAPGAELAVIEEVTAGAVPTRSIERGTATRIMTGAPLPAGADAVVMVEQTTLTGDRVRIGKSAKAGQNIMRRGTSLTCGQVVLQPGKVLRAIEIGLLAEVGRKEVATVRWPRVAILPTGNELVDHEQSPGPGQIRNSNGPMLAGLAIAAGAETLDFPIVPDDAEALIGEISGALTSDVVLLSGGVSAGVLDLVPQVLAELGVERVFHKVNLKPGKPLWFGVKENAEIGRQTLVFGLPGNPVSGLVCFELFVRPAIEKLSGREPKGLSRRSAVLTKEHKQRGERPTYWPARVREVEPQLLPSLSRELQTPLHNIIGFTEALEAKDTLNEKEKRYVQQILRSGRDLQELIGDLLRLAVEYGHAPSPTRATVAALPWQGSGDLRTLADANCLIHFPAGDRLFREGETVEVLLLPEP